MKKWMLPALLFLAVPVFAQDQKKEEPATLKSTLMIGLKETHNDKQWFVSAKEAVAGLTAEQASWKDGKGNHSVGELVYHIVFWNQRALAQLKKEPVDKFGGNNDETFDKFDAKQWNDLTKKLEDLMTQYEQAVNSADESTLAKWAPTLERVGLHNAYHIGEIVVVRKEQGSWNPANGVK